MPELNEPEPPKLQIDMIANQMISHMLYAGFAIAIDGDPLGASIGRIASKVAILQARWLTQVFRAAMPIEIFILAQSPKPENVDTVLEWLVSQQFTLRPESNSEDAGLIMYMNGKEISRFALNFNI